MRSEELQRKAWDAEDEGKEVYVQGHDVYEGVIEYIEIDGVEHYNDEFRDELEDAYWAEDAYQVADHYWRD